MVDRAPASVRKFRARVPLDNEAVRRASQQDFAILNPLDGKQNLGFHVHALRDKLGTCGFPIVAGPLEVVWVVKLAKGRMGLNRRSLPVIEVKATGVPVVVVEGLGAVAGLLKGCGLPTQLLVDLVREVHVHHI